MINENEKINIIEAKKCDEKNICTYSRGSLVGGHNERIKGTKICISPLFPTVAATTF
jgi:hypothetical protein